MAMWRHSFDFCDSHRLDAQRYIDHHVDLLLNGLTRRRDAAASDSRGWHPGVTRKAGRRP
jgi:hypothetical protein